MSKQLADALPLQNSWVFALFACAVAAVLEGVLSGTRVRQRFAELRLPQPALPLWAWSIVGVAYYCLHFLVLNSILGSPPTANLTATALSLVTIVLGANAARNWVFFRKKDLRLSALYFVPYASAAVALSLALFRPRTP